MTPYEFDAERFSRWMAYVLRHNPTRYGLQPDRYGYVDLEGFLLVASRRYRDISPERLRDLIETNGTVRFEVLGQRVRARYGHSIAVEPPGHPSEPPIQLYHGAEAAHAASILSDGLRPTDRRLLHLSETADEALAIALRKTDRPSVWRVAAREAHLAGIAFYREGKVYLVAHLPARFLVQEPVSQSIDPLPARP